MSISSEINRIKTAIADAYESADEKGATLPTNQNVTNLASTIDSITGGGGITPSGTITITENGTHDVTQYASALVNVAGGGGGDIVGFKIEQNESGSVTKVESVGITTPYNGMFSYYDEALTTIIVGEGCTKMTNRMFRQISVGSVSVYFPSSLTKINTAAFSSCAGIKDIYTPWSETQMTGAPWGATYATIHYNYIPPTE